MIETKTGSNEEINTYAQIGKLKLIYNFIKKQDLWIFFYPENKEFCQHSFTRYSSTKITSIAQNGIFWRSSHQFCLDEALNFHLFMLQKSPLTDNPNTQNNFGKTPNYCPLFSTWDEPKMNMEKDQFIVQ